MRKNINQFRGANMDEWQYPGARWWRFDFHTHTPASNDFRQDGDEVTPEFWLKAFMKKGIDCVAITDHNSGDWVDLLKHKLEEWEQMRPDWYRPLYLFPGVEISVNGNVHVLALFGRDKDKRDIDEILGAVGYRGSNGDSNGVTTKSIPEVVNEIANRGGISIPAHVDRKRGLFCQLHGTTLEQALENENIYAAELHDGTYQKPQLYIDKKLQWTEVNGSDTHSLDEISTFTWVKMDTPSIDGLELALRDGPASVNKNMANNPNRYADCLMEELEVHQAKYIGRSKPLNFRFSPFLNTIIGGRGSGKSTLLEFMRLALRRAGDIPDPLKEESHQYFNVGGDNLLIEDSKISLIYRKGEVRYRLNWSARADCPSLEEQRDNNWVPCPGEITSLFSVHIYSQKQIFELAKDPRALIRVIDDAPEVGFKALQSRYAELINQYKQIEGRQRDLNEKIAQENRLRGEFNDLTRQIEQIEKSGHKEVLQNYRKRRQQLNELDNLESQWKKMSNRILEVRDGITPADFNTQHFIDHAQILPILRATNEKWQVIQEKLSELTRETESILVDWHVEKDIADWMQALKTDMEQYESLSTELKQQGIEPDRYPQLLVRQKSIQKELDLISEYRARQQQLETEKQEMFEQIEKNRKMLSEKRQEFLTTVLENNQFVSIEVEPFGEDWDTIESEIRDILQCEEHFDRDIEHLKGIYQNGGDKKIEKLKKVITSIRNGEETAKHASFANRLRRLPQESVIDLNLWFPGDNLKITFGPDHQRIEQGSPGQKTAALLAFILSYGNEPLLLDQPEDDLDNELIYNLIVKQLRKTKSKRQVIIVTHNANIVVNGDAEMVFPLKVAGGETHVRRTSSIQEKEVREAICDILEGGRQAFEQRYRRIHLRR